ncbi:minor tail protein [Mycobacterium phage Zenteno07]|nr:minor tail protein [Mycobacterium phage Zenteno07]
MTVVTDNQIVSLHTASGVQWLDFTPDNYTSCSWGRKQRDASSCDLVLPPGDEAVALYERVAQWRDWLSVYDGDVGTLLWSGPIQQTRRGRRGLSIQAKDHGAYLMRTRNPITRRWDGADPSAVAGRLWEAMVEAQGLTSRVIINPDPEGDRFDFQVLTDEQMLDQTVRDLVNLGLKWAVVSNTAIIGPLGLEPIATLSEDDFQGDGLEFIRDGSQTFNDVLVRGPDNLARATVDYYGQNLQTIANVDSMFGVSNVSRAAQQYVGHTGKVRTRLELAAGTELSPDAPVSIEELMPSTRFVIEGDGVRQLFELTAVDVDRSSRGASVKVTMESVEEDIELLDTKDQPVMTLGGQTL